jgi:hypothetical protein
MTTESKAAFARRMGWHRSSVTRAADAGRIVLEGDLVDVEASLEKIKISGSSEPHHLAHAAQLEEQRQAQTAPMVEQHPAQTAPEPVKIEARHTIDELNLRIKAADADKREHEADIARMDREQRAGNLIAREVVDFVLNDYAASLRSLMETRADRLAPVIYPLQSMEEVHAALTEADENILHEMTAAMKHKAEAYEAQA